MDDLSFAIWFWAGLGTIALAILSGAGGSALLELLWKPRRDRRRVAGTLIGEILANTELALLWAHARQHKPRSIPSDIHFSNIGWQAVGGLVSELHPDLVKSILLLYRRYEHLNFCVVEYGRTLDELQAVSATKSESYLKKQLDSTIDVFNTSIDTVIEQGKKLAGQLLPLAGLKESKPLPAPTRDYAKDVEKLLADRAARTKRLGELDA